MLASKAKIKDKLTINKLKTIIKNKSNQIKNLKLKMKTLQQKLNKSEKINPNFAYSISNLHTDFIKTHFHSSTNVNIFIKCVLKNALNSKERLASFI